MSLSARPARSRWVKGDRGAGELAEERLARLGQLDVMDAAVDRVPAAGDQPVSLHRVQVMGQGDPAG